MPVIIPREPETAKRVRVQIGDQWMERSFARPVEIERARSVAIEMVELLTLKEPRP